MINTRINASITNLAAGAQQCGIAVVTAEGCRQFNVGIEVVARAHGANHFIPGPLEIGPPLEPMQAKR